MVVESAVAVDGGVMRAFAMVVLTVLPLVGCSDGPTQPTTSANVVAPSIFTPPTTIWRAQSTVVSVSPTLNSCPVDNAVGQTRSVDWAVQDGFVNPHNPQLTILLFESAGVYDPQHGTNYITDPRTPVYYGSRTGDQLTAMAEQDGMPTCFVWHGDLTGSFSPDGLTFAADETIRYTLFSEGDMVVSRHWTGTRR
jgi:hypothetical protein